MRGEWIVVNRWKGEFATISAMNQRVNYMSTARMDEKVKCPVAECGFSGWIHWIHNEYYRELENALPDIMAKFNNGKTVVRYELSELFKFGYCTGNNLGFIGRCIKVAPDLLVMCTSDSNQDAQNLFCEWHGASMSQKMPVGRSRRSMAVFVWNHNFPS